MLAAVIAFADVVAAQTVVVVDSAVEIVEGLPMAHARPVRPRFRLQSHPPGMFLLLSKATKLLNRLPRPNQRLLNLSYPLPQQRRPGPACLHLFPNRLLQSPSRSRLHPQKNQFQCL